ncbi:MAG: type 4a pilus biogenesis protein PilO, partial [Rhodoglobus sp.]|nr:type 4a pilus biogenesis protein PilO [Rhodoglobus sp.]
MTQGNRLWVAACATIMVVLVAAGWFLGIQPALAATAEADTQRAAVESQLASQQATISALEAEQRKLPSLKKTYALLQKSVPGEADTSRFITSLDALAVAAGVQILGFTVAEPVAYTVPGSAAAPAASTEEGATDAPVAPVQPTGPTAAPVVTNPLITSDNFVTIEMGIDVGGSYEAV